MVSDRVKSRRAIVIVAASVLTVILLAGFFFSGGDSKPKAVEAPTTTTTLPKKNAQACEFLTKEALQAGGIIPDVDAKTSDDKKRCTYEDIGGEVGYITLYVDTPAQCDTLIAAATNKIALPEVSPSAVYYDELDPTIIVSQADRCFWVQGAKTLIGKAALTAIAKYVNDLFVQVDTSTTTTTQTTVVLPEAPTTLPGQNTAPSTSASST